MPVVIVGIVMLLTAFTIYLTTRGKVKGSNPKLMEVSFREFKATLWQTAFIQTFTTCGIILTTLGLIL